MLPGMSETVLSMAVSSWWEFLTEQFEFHVAMLEETQKKDARRARCWSHKKSCHRLSLLAARQRKVVDVLEDSRRRSQQEELFVGVPVPHAKKEIVDVPVEVLHVIKEFVGEPVPLIAKEVRQEIVDTPRSSTTVLCQASRKRSSKKSRIFSRSAFPSEQEIDVPFPHVMERESWSCEVDLRSAFNTREIMVSGCCSLLVCRFFTPSSFALSSHRECHCLNDHLREEIWCIGRRISVLRKSLLGLKCLL